MEEKLIYEHKNPDIMITTDRIVVGSQTIPASTHECKAIFSSKGLIFKTNQFYIAYSRGDNVHRQEYRINYTMTLKYEPREKAKMLSEYDVSLHLVSKSLSKDEMKTLSTEINQAIGKAAAYQQAAVRGKAQSELAEMKKLDRI